MWFGAALTLAGLVRACPAIVSRLATHSRSLPLSPRLAIRDAGRHRHRTAPAVAAVMTVVAGAVLVLFVASSSDLREKKMFTNGVPVGDIAVRSSGGHLGGGRTLADAAAQTAGLVGGGQSFVIQHASAPGHGLLTAVAPGCSADRSDDLARCQVRTIGVAGTETIDALTGRTVTAAHEAWRDGKAVVLLPVLMRGNSISIRALGPDPHGSASTRLTAYAVSGVPFYASVPQVYVSPATARAHGWRTHNEIAVVQPTHRPSPTVVDRAQHALGSDIYIYLQNGFQSRYSTVLIAMLGAAAIATLAGTSIAVALAMAESRADMATMAAVGASPARRRMHAMGQAAIVAGLGTGLGLVLGALVAVATLAGSERYPTSTPFRWLVGVLILAPALAIAVAGLVTRSRVTLTRRIA